MKYSEIRNLAELGLISPEQADAVVAHFKLSPRAPRNYLLITFSVLGGLLVLAGVVLLVSANWELTPPFVKQLSGAALMLACWGAGLRFMLRAENPRPFFGEALCFVGAGMWLANIALYGQIYQISARPSYMVGVWFLGIFLFPQLVRLRGVFAMSLLAAWIWLCCLLEENSRLTDDFYFYFLAFFALVSALGIFLGGLNEKARERVRGYGPIALWTAFPALILLAQFFCYTEAKASASAVFALVPAAAIFFVVLVISFREKLASGLGMASALVVSAFPLTALAAGFLKTAASGREYDTLIHATMIGALFVCGTAAMSLGAVVSRKFFVNAGALMILFAALALVANILGSLMQSGFALIFAGALLLGFGFFLERHRRKLTARIKKNSSEIPPENRHE